MCHESRTSPEQTLFDTMNRDQAREISRSLATIDLNRRQRMRALRPIQMLRRGYADPHPTLRWHLRRGTLQVFFNHGSHQLIK